MHGERGKADGTSHRVRWAVALAGMYYTSTGLWPLFHLRSFEAVTGPKTDDWLVHMVGLLAAAIGVTLVAAAVRNDWSAPLRILAISTPAAFGAIDVIYATIGRIRPIYLVDAVVQVAFIVCLLPWVRRGREKDPPRDDDGRTARRRRTTREVPDDLAEDGDQAVS
jgi:energy-converting hydrogenase Eha subunit E